MLLAIEVVFHVIVSVYCSNKTMRDLLYDNRYWICIEREEVKARRVIEAKE